MKEIKTAIRLLLIFTVLLGFVYPLLITAIAQVAFPREANGSLVTRQGVVVGSELIAQSFQRDRYFFPRPSANNYDASNYGGSNYGPMHETLVQTVTDRTTAMRTAHGLAAQEPIPADLVTASGSGLDPHISVASALLQVRRVAHARNMKADDVATLVARLTERPVIGQPLINVFKLNLALEALATLGSK